VQWAHANVVGEVLGLGLAGAVATLMILTAGEPKTAFVALLMAAVMIAAGTLHRRGGVPGRRIGAEHSLNSSGDCRRRRSNCRRDPRPGSAVGASPASGRKYPSA